MGACTRLEAPFLFLLETFWTNPQFRLTLLEPDEEEDDEDEEGPWGGWGAGRAGGPARGGRIPKCTVLLSLIQRNRRKLRAKGLTYLTVGFHVFQVRPWPAEGGGQGVTGVLQGRGGNSGWAREGAEGGCLVKTEGTGRGQTEGQRSGGGPRGPHRAQIRDGEVGKESEETWVRDGVGGSVKVQDQRNGEGLEGQAGDSEQWHSLLLVTPAATFFLLTDSRGGGSQVWPSAHPPTSPGAWSTSAEEEKSGSGGQAGLARWPGGAVGWRSWGGSTSGSWSCPAARSCSASGTPRAAAHSYRDCCAPTARSSALVAT